MYRYDIVHAETTTASAGSEILLLREEVWHVTYISYIGPDFQQAQACGDSTPCSQARGACMNVSVCYALQLGKATAL